MDILPDSAWHTFASPGTDLMWHSTHVWTGGRVNPACTHLLIDWQGPLSAIDGPTAHGNIPATYALRQNLPNPFTDQTAIAYDLPVASGVGLRIFDAQGRLVRTVVSQEHPAGRYSAVWDGNDDGGRPVSAGVYLLRMVAGDFRATTKVMRIQ